MKFIPPLINTFLAKWQQTMPKTTLMSNYIKWGEDNKWKGDSTNTSNEALFNCGAASHEMSSDILDCKRLRMCFTAALLTLLFHSSCKIN